MQKIQSPLFQNVTEKEWNQMLAHNCMRTQHFNKNTVIFHMGDMVQDIGIVLSGSINIENVDLWGNKSLLKKLFMAQQNHREYAPNITTKKYIAGKPHFLYYTKNHPWTAAHISVL